MRRDSGVNHAVAICSDCGWRNENRKNALATAAIHARKHGHEVSVDQCLGITYNRRASDRT